VSHAPRVLAVGLHVARALRDEGFEAIEVAEGVAPAALVGAAVDEDVDAICVPAGSGGAVASELTGRHVEIALVEVLDVASVAAAVRAAIR
jgi:methylmalonyl-CoA mutase cobalamin-binding subunit